MGLSIYVYNLIIIFEFNNILFLICYICLILMLLNIMFVISVLIIIRYLFVNPKIKHLNYLLLCLNLMILISFNEIYIINFTFILFCLQNNLMLCIIQTIQSILKLVIIYFYLFTRHYFCSHL